MENEQGSQQQLATLPINEITSLYKTASSCQVLKEEQEQLLAKFDDTIVKIKPDGNIYIPGAYYRKRLNDALGVGQWSLIPKHSSQEVKPAEGEGKGSTDIFVGAILVIRGCFVAESMGKGEVFESNENQSKDDAWESAQTNALTRCCKALSIGFQIYDTAYIKKWKEENAVKVWRKNKTKPSWRRKDDEPFYDETGLAQQGGGAAPVVAKMNPNDSKPWLNKTIGKGSETLSQEWIKAVDDIIHGLVTLPILEAKYKINGPSIQELKVLEIDWDKALARCTTPELYNNLRGLHEELIQADANIKNKFSVQKAAIVRGHKKTA